VNDAIDQWRVATSTVSLCRRQCGRRWTSLCIAYIGLHRRNFASQSGGDRFHTLLQDLRVATSVGRHAACMAAARGLKGQQRGWILREGQLHQPRSLWQRCKLPQSPVQIDFYIQYSHCRRWSMTATILIVLTVCRSLKHNCHWKIVEMTLQVDQGHWQWHNSIGHTSLFLLLVYSNHAYLGLSGRPLSFLKCWTSNNSMSLKSGLGGHLRSLKVSPLDISGPPVKVFIYYRGPTAL